MSGAPLLDDKVILITGAASGIGAATARLAAREGALLCLADIDRAGADDLAGSISQEGGRATATHVDVANEDSIALMMKAVDDAYGRLDGAFNNAGIGTVATNSSGKRLHEIADEGWEKMIAVNLGGVWRCMKHEIPLMKAGGSIVNTASIAGLVGLPTAAAYVAAKHGVVGLSRAAAIDYGADGIRVNALCPGYVDTPLTGHASASKREKVSAATPLRRFADAAEIAETAVWLLSERSSFTTGAAVAVDGGYTAR